MCNRRRDTEIHNTLLYHVHDRNMYITTEHSGNKVSFKVVFMNQQIVTGMFLSFDGISECSLNTFAHVL